MSLPNLPPDLGAQIRAMTRRIYELERRRNLSGNDGPGGASVASQGSFEFIGSNAITTPTSSFDDLGNHAGLKSWTRASYSTGSFLDLTATDGTVTITAQGLYAITGNLIIAGIDDAGANGGLECFLTADVVPVAAVTAGIWAPAATLPAAHMQAIPLNYFGVLHHFNVVAGFGTTPVGTGGPDGRNPFVCQLMVQQFE